MCSYHDDLGRVYQVGATQREEAILADLYHPLHAEFRPLPSEGRYTFPYRANSNKNSRSFLPLAVFFFFFFKQAAVVAALALRTNELLEL